MGEQPVVTLVQLISTLAELSARRLRVVQSLITPGTIGIYSHPIIDSPHYSATDNTADPQLKIQEPAVLSQHPDVSAHAETSDSLYTQGRA